MHHKEVGLCVDTANIILAAFPDRARLVVAGLEGEYKHHSSFCNARSGGGETGATTTGPSLSDDDEGTTAGKGNENNEGFSYKAYGEMIQSLLHGRTTTKKTIVLFPSENARTFREITRQLEEHEPQICRDRTGQSALPFSSSELGEGGEEEAGDVDEGWDVVVIDGTWTQARRLHSRLHAHVSEAIAAESELRGQGPHRTDCATSPLPSPPTPPVPAPPAPAPQAPAPAPAATSAESPASCAPEAVPALAGVGSGVSSPAIITYVCLSGEAVERLGQRPPPPPPPPPPHLTARERPPRQADSSRLKAGSADSDSNLSSARGAQLRRHPIAWREVSTLEALRLLLLDMAQSLHEKAAPTTIATATAATAATAKKNTNPVSDTCAAGSGSGGRGGASNRARKGMDSFSRGASDEDLDDESPCALKEAQLVCEKLASYQALHDEAAKRQLGPPRLSPHRTGEAQ